MNKVYDRHEKERNEALARVEAMLLRMGSQQDFFEEVQGAVDRGFDLNTNDFDLNHIGGVDP